VQDETAIASNFTQSIFYEIELTAKYCKLLGAQVFEKFEIDIPIEEFSVLDTLGNYPDICQRDLAKIILKDRANTGKILDSLERKGLVERHLSIKKNRPVKIVRLTEQGELKKKEVTERIRPHILMVRDKIQNSDLGKLRDMLSEFREVLGTTIELKI
jgi:DNA-binding MarR family transcriptional regulator